MREKKKKKKKNHSFNVDEEDVGKTKNFTNFAKKTKSCCYAIDETKVLLGTNGDVDYEKAKSALKSWKQFQLGWTEVDEATRVRLRYGELNLYLSLKKRFSVTSDGLVFWRKEKAAKQNVFSKLDTRDIEHVI